MSETKSSLEVAAEAAARVNAMLIAKGKLKLPPPSASSKTSAGLKVGLGESYTAEVEINDAPLAARNLLTRGLIQDEINKLSGAAISTRGRYMNSDEKVTNLNERPLYLHIQATIKDAVEKAVDRVHRVIEQQLRLSSMSPIKWSRVATTAWNSPSYVTEPPPLIPNGPQPTYVQEKVFVGLDHLPPSYEVKEKMLGPGESYLNHIRTETGASVTLRGKCSGHVEPTSGRESFEPLHLFLTHSKVDGLQAAKDLAVHLVQTVQQECTQIQQQQTLAVLTLQSQQSAINAQQVALQQSLHLPVVNANALALGAGHGTVTQLGVSQASLQNAQLQLGGLGTGTVATSIPSAVFHTPLTNSMPGVLTTNQSGQLQMLPGQVLTQQTALGGEVVPGLLDPNGGLRTMVTTSTMLLQPSTQLVYTQALQPQHHLVHSGQATLVHGGGALNGGHLQLAAQQQMAVANQMALQARTAQVTTQGQQLGLAPTTFYLLSQGSMLNMAATGQMPDGAVQMQLGCTADALQAQLAQVQVQQAQAQARASVQLQNQQRQQLQQNQQQQFQARAIQVGGPMPTVVSAIGAQINTSYPYQMSQANGVSTVGSITSSTVTYPHFRSRPDALSVQKRKFQEDMPIRDGYMQHGLASLRGQNQSSSLSSSTSPLGQPRPQHYSTITTTATSGFQSNLASGSTMPPYLMAAQESGNLSAPDREQKNAPPPLHAFQGGNNVLNGEMQRKRMKSGLFNNSSYGSSEEEDNNLSLNARRLQRNAPMRHRGYGSGGGGYDGELAAYQRRASDELHAISVSMSQQQSSQSLPGQYCGSLSAVPQSPQQQQQQPPPNLPPPASVAQQVAAAANLSSALYANFPEHIQQQQLREQQLAPPSISAIGYGQGNQLRYQYQSQF